MNMRYFMVAAVLAFSPVVADEVPNIQPGLWELQSTSSFPGSPMPPQTETVRECMTEDDIKDGLKLDIDVDECEVRDLVMRADGMSYGMVCEHDDGMNMEMNATIRFLGDRTDGLMEAEMETPMGPMQMRIELEGHRVGDC